jgi:hypothetical protein
MDFKESMREYIGWFRVRKWKGDMLLFNYIRLLTRGFKSWRILGRCYTDPKRTQMPAQTTTPSKTLNFHRWKK